MKPPADGWDRDERDVLELEGLSAELEAVRARHALSPEDEARLLARIQHDAQGTRKALTGRSWQWGFVLVAASVLLVIGTVWTLRRSDDAARDTDKQPASTVAVATPAPAYQLPLEKPELKMSPSGLAWRGPGGENTLLADLKPAFDAFRESDYQRADREFSAISGRYPRSVEIALYQGVARLFLGNVTGAIDSLGAAEKLADSALGWDVAWYRAVADERGGNFPAARARLTTLCAQPDARAKTACEALSRLR